MADRATRVDVLFGLAYPDSRVRRTSQALAAAGYDVRVLAWDRTGAAPRRARDGAVRVEHARVRSRSGRGASQLAYLARAVWSHLPALRRDRPDVIHAVDLPMLAAALALRPLIGRPRLVYDAFEIYALMEAHKYPAWLLRVIRGAERRLPRRADLVVTPGAARQAYFAERGVASCVVGNWVDAPVDHPERASARAALQIGPEPFVIAYAGGIEPSRDIGSLLRHAERAPRDVVVIAGRGEQADEVRRAAERNPNVRFIGWTDDPGRLYAAADAVYYALHPDHPYAAHAAPNNLYAAIAWAVPLVHRGQGEIGAAAREAQIGAAFDDDASLDQAIDALRDPERQAAVRASLRGLQDRYTARRAAEALIDAYPLPPHKGDRS
jgi:glycosyltransferase involved in cell wall biosynthesis